MNDAPSEGISSPDSAVFPRGFRRISGIGRRSAPPKKMSADSAKHSKTDLDRCGTFFLLLAIATMSRLLFWFAALCAVLLLLSPVVRAQSDDSPDVEDEDREVTETVETGSNQVRFASDRAD